MDWKKIFEVVGNDAKVTRVEGNNLALEGEFELPPLSRLAMEDQIFVAAFIGVHGSIKEMEKLFGISYPTVKGRLRKIADSLREIGLLSTKVREDRTTTLELLASKEITVEEALERLKCSQ